MKKNVVAILMMLLCLNSITAIAEDRKSIKARVENMSETQKEERYLQLQKRVDEIRSMDKSALDAQERKALRKELKNMKREAGAMGKTLSYVSIVVGVALIVILLVTYL